MEEIFKVYKESYSRRYKKRVYEVSNFGNVKLNGVLCQLKINKYNGYLYFGRGYVHRAVAELFIPNPQKKPCVDHIDTNRQNNNVNNLRWVTYKENCNNPISKKNLSKALKNANLNHSGQKNGMYGKHHSQEAKTTIGKKQSISWKNKSEEEKNKILEARSKSYGKRIWINKDGITKWVRIEDLHLYPNFNIGRK